ncbi:phage portal protein [Caballeronia sp. ATUFL_M2_KS44]|uniref:anti-CBASS protein Acb1 family protein n=1 Tax=Caballeronia sp. ATUFL_M2_KS44 TaxID=2921767 RepID=UPI00202948DD
MRRCACASVHAAAGCARRHRAGRQLACDSACDANFRWALSSAFAEGLGFLGYPYLAELTQRPEYCRPAEILAKEMTRKWIRLQGAGDDDKSEKIAAIDAEMKRLSVQAVFRKVAEQDGFFGRAQLFLDMCDDRPEELIAPLADSTVKMASAG